MAKPKIRIKGFEDEWVNFLIKEVASIRGGYAFKSNNFSNQGIPVVRISNILENGIVGGDYVFYNKMSELLDYELNYQDIVIAMSGATTGKVAIVQNNDTIFYQNQRVGYFNTNNNVNNYFLYSLLNSKYFYNNLHSLLATGAQPNISGNDIDTIYINIPINLNEQQAIADYFKSLDSMIQAATKKISSLKQMKQACLVSMFPQAGETTPRVRFKGFEGEWEKKLLSDCLEISNEKNFDNKYGRGDVLSVSDDYGVMNQIELLGRSYAGKSVSNYGILRTGEIVYTKSPLKSKPFGIVKQNTGKTGIVSVLYAIFVPKEGTAADFIHYYFDPDWRLNAYLRPLVNKGAKNTMNISDDTALNGCIMIPKNVKEQQKIASFFRSLDTQISLQEARLEKLKQIKSACLDKMFV